jgi:hypothetical protein
MRGVGGPVGTGEGNRTRIEYNLRGGAEEGLKVA